MIWILALVVLAAGVGMGLRLGVIPTTVSFLALIIASCFAAMLGGLFQHVLPHLGISNPVLAWMIAPIIGFFLVYVILMSMGLEVHRRVNVYYKYKAGDLRLALWERLNHRLGACMGVVNGTAWLVLVCFFVFNLSYVTAQIAPSEKETAMTRFMNNLGQGLQSTGMDKPARALGNVPPWFYKTADFAGLLAQNPAMSQRLGSYPAFISLSQRSEIQALESDSSLVDAWQQGTPMSQIFNDPQIKSILNNTDLVDSVWNIIQTNMDDMTNYLFTGKSSKFDSDKIVGYWNFDPIPSLSALMQAHPEDKFTDKQMEGMRGFWVHTFTNITLVAGTDGQMFLYNNPKFSPKNPLMEIGTENDTGQWTTDDGSNYQLNASGELGSTTATTDGMRLSIDTGKGFPVIFRRTYQPPN